MREMTFEELNKKLAIVAELAGKGAVIRARDAVSGAILRSLEFGSVAGERPWPRPGDRTTLAVDPETGNQVVVSLRAPQGIFRTHAPGFAESLLAELRQQTSWLDKEHVNQHLARAVRATAGIALEKARQSVGPRLAEALEVAAE